MSSVRVAAEDAENHPGGWIPLLGHGEALQRDCQCKISTSDNVKQLPSCVLQILVHLNNRCLPDVLNDIVVHGAHDPEEFPFLEELHVLRRLQVRHLFVKVLSECISIRLLKISIY